MDDASYMQMALDLAQKARGMTSPNPLVGAVIVKGDKIISTGFHQKCGGPHAEIIALKKAGLKAQGARLYLTLEPCCHYGRTPPCVDQIIKAHLKEVIIAMKDPNPLVAGRSIAQLKRARIKVKVGVLESHARQINRAFVKYITLKQPFVVAKCAQTIDGKIATASGHSKWITSERSRQFAKKIRDEFDAILVGINTVIKDNPKLAGLRKSKGLKKIILDSRLQIPLNSFIVKNSAHDCIVATTAAAQNKKIKQLRSRGINVIIGPKRGRYVDLTWVFKKLAEKEITSILIEGGAKVIGRALEERLVDEMHIYIAPKIMGDQNALSSIAGLDSKQVSRLIQLKNLRLQTIRPDIFLTALVDYKR